MPLQKLQFRPGVNREGTSLANEGGWFESDKVRFRSGYPEKIGGWVKDLGNESPTDTDLDIPLATGFGSYLGVCRSLWNWLTLSGYNLLGIGTHLKFYIQTSANGTVYDVTPIRATTTIANNAFTTSIISGNDNLVIVNAPNHGVQVGDYVLIHNVAPTSPLTDINGIPVVDLEQEFQVVSVQSDSKFAILCSNVAQFSGTTGSCEISFEMKSGTDLATTAAGWGAGGWSGVTTPNASTALNGALNSSATTITVGSTTGFSATGQICIDTEVVSYSGKTSTTFTGCTRGYESTAAAHADGTTVFQYPNPTGWGEAASEGFAVNIRLWSQSNFGENLLFNARGGAMNFWAVNTTPTTIDRGQVLVAGGTVTQKNYTTGGIATVDIDATCPSQVNYLMVSDASRFTIAFGCNDPTGVYATPELDPMQIRWSDQESYADWIPAATNQAGSYRLSHGSQIVTAIQTRQEILVLTDTAIYSMQFLGAPYVWGFQLMGDNISILGPNAAVTVNNITYWMGTDKFYMYSGRVETLPCSVRQYVYDDIDLSQGFQVFGGTNEGYNEIWWFYCSSGSTTVDKYVIYNHLERTWAYGTLARTAWLDSPMRASPMSTTYGQAQFTASISGSTMTVTSIQSGYLGYDMILSGEGIPENTYVTSIPSASGGVGTYEIAPALTELSSRTIFGAPATPTGFLIYQENGNDDGLTVPPTPIYAYVRSSDFDIGDGHNFGLVWRIIPDVTFDGSTVNTPQVNFTVLPRANPGANYGTSDNPAVASTQNYQNERTYNVQQFTQFTYVRIRGRQMAFEISSDQLGVAWQLGSPRLDVRPDGRR
jgi:hypothetical protein